MTMPLGVLEKRLRAEAVEMEKLRKALAHVNSPGEAPDFRDWRDRVCVLLEHEVPWAFNQFRAIRFAARSSTRGPFVALAPPTSPVQVRLTDEPDSDVFQRGMSFAAHLLREVTESVAAGVPSSGAPPGMPTELLVERLERAGRELEELAVELGNASDPAYDSRFVAWRRRVSGLLESECFETWPHTGFRNLFAGLYEDSGPFGDKAALADRPERLRAAHRHEQLFSQTLEAARLHLLDVVIQSNRLPRARRAEQPSFGPATGSVSINVARAHAIQLQTGSPGASQSLTILPDPAPWLEAIPRLKAAAEQLSGAEADQARAGVDALEALVKAPEPQWPLIGPVLRNLHEFAERVGSSLLAGQILELIKRAGDAS